MLLGEKFKNWGVGGSNGGVDEAGGKWCWAGCAVPVVRTKCHFSEQHFPSAIIRRRHGHDGHDRGKHRGWDHHRDDDRYY